MNNHKCCCDDDYDEKGHYEDDNDHIDVYYAVFRSSTSSGSMENGRLTSGYADGNDDDPEFIGASRTTAGATELILADAADPAHLIDISSLVGLTCIDGAAELHIHGRYSFTWVVKAIPFDKLIQ